MYGGKGGLGTVLVQHLKSEGCWVCSVDLVANPEADENVLVSLSAGWVEQEQGVCQGVAEEIERERERFVK